MAVSFVVVPEWQASGSARAMRLVDGAEAIRGDLPSASTRVVEVPLEAGDAQGTGVHRLSSIAIVRDRVLQMLQGVTGPVVAIGGDCGIELGAVSRAASPDMAVVWFDAHPDLNTPESSPSGAFGGMVLRTLLGDGASALVPEHPLDPSRVVIVGTRAIDEGEAAYLAHSRIPVIGPDEASAESVAAAVAATGATSVYVHVDLDVLDPAELDGLSAPLPFGMRAGQLVDTVRALRESFELAGAGITAFSPASMTAAVEDMPTILRLIGALAR